MRPSKRSMRTFDAYMIDRFESSMGEAADYLREILADEESEEFPYMFLHAVYLLSKAYASDIAPGGRGHGDADE